MSLAFACDPSQTGAVFPSSFLMTMSRLKASLLVSFAAGLTLGVVGTGIAASLGSSVFTDVDEGAYYDSAIGELYAQGIIKGLTSTKFGPNDPITRGQVAVLLQRLEQHLNGTLAQASSSQRSSIASSSSSVSSSSSSSSSSSVASQTPQGMLRFTSNAYTVTESLSTVTIAVVRTGGNQGTVTVDYETQADTAVPGTDYTNISGTLTMAPKETSKTFTVQIVNNPLAQGNKTFKLLLKNATNGSTLGSPSTAVVTIFDNQSSSTSSTASSGASSSSSSVNPAGVLGFSAAGFTPNEAGGSLTITVNRVGGTTGAVSVTYGTSNGTATAGADYNATSGTLSFAAGEGSKTFTVSMIDNSTLSGNKTFSIILGAPTGGATLSSVLATTSVTIHDDETVAYGSGSLKFSKETYQTTKASGSVNVTVLRTGGASGTVTVNYATNNGSASAGTDFVASSGTLSFLPGESSKIISIPIIKTTASVENGKTFSVDLSGPSGSVPLVIPYSSIVNIGN